MHRLPAFVRSFAAIGLVIGLAAAVLGADVPAGVQVPEDLARGKPATASSVEGDDRRPWLANDGDSATRWCASGSNAPQWWQVDLGGPNDLTGCRLGWEFPGEAYRYRVEGSADAQTWRTLVDQTGDGRGPSDGAHKFTARSVRFVRLTVTGMENGHWASLFVVEVHGTRMVDAPARTHPVAAEGLLAGLKVPPRFKATLFAAPPDVHYPTCLAAAPAGAVFVGIDENGSIDAKPGRGRVVRCIDSDGDGRADRFNVFARMDSPRGLICDDRTLYVLHPPRLSAYHDDDGDGVADRNELLVRGLGFDLKFRGADHTTNGIQLGIDGWIYVAVGDYGFIKAEGRDGTTRQLRGGGVVRVRPDGTGLEIFARGTRNIYDVAIDPFANVFTRDNTNDGGGWNVRLSHIIPMGQYGYPSLFVNFPDDIVAPLADYGGGSPTGSLYVQDATLPEGFNDTLYTCDWGRNVVYRHPLTPNGAGFRAEQKPFIELPRPTDIDIDGSGNLYIATWRDGGFTYSGPNVGYVVRVSPEQAPAGAFPNLASATEADLLRALAGDTQVLRLRAQRALLRRGGKGLVGALRALATSNSPLAGRVAAVFTLAQLHEANARDALAALTERKELREYALRALGDRTWEASAIPGMHFVKALDDPDPRVRLQSVVASGRLNKAELAARIVPLTADDDPLVAHAAVHALVTLRAVDAALAAVDPAAPRFVAGTCRVLRAIHEPNVVDGLIDKLAVTRDPAFRRPVLEALCRLHFRAGEWRGQWWGTRPDTSGPYYEPVGWEATETIGRALRRELHESDPTTRRWLLGEMLRHKIDPEDLTPLILETAAHDPAFRRRAATLLAGRPKLSPQAIRLLASVAADDAEDTSLRVSVLQGLRRHTGQREALDAAVHALAPIGVREERDDALLVAWRDFARDAGHGRQPGYFRDLAQSGRAGESVLGYAVLVGLGGRNRAPERLKADAADAIAAAWSRPETTAALLRAVGRLQDTSFGPDVRARLNAENASVRDAARFAARELGLDRGKSAGVTLAKLPFEQVVEGALKDKGDPALGARLFQRQGCINCHTVSAKEAPKGPLLAGIAARYDRKELTESILRPSARIAQGFETQKFATVDGRTLDGFVVRESGDEVEFRGGNGSVTVLKKSEIEERGKSEVSVMPTGLGDPLTVHELASILGYLESLKAD